MLTKAASDLAIGDVVKINAQCLWRVVALETQGKTVTVQYEWDMRSKASWKHDGPILPYSHRLTTKLHIITD